MRRSESGAASRSWEGEMLIATDIQSAKERAMIQIIFMVIGVVYLFKLIGIEKTGSRLGLDAETLAKWQGHRRKQYLWMIAAGWGSFVIALVITIVIGAAVDSMTENVALGVQIAMIVVGLITMFSCYSISSREAKKAVELEAGKAVPPDSTT
jgi:Na+/melibiose symporter-like transporter